MLVSASAIKRKSTLLISFDFILKCIRVQIFGSRERKKLEEKRGRGREKCDLETHKESVLKLRLRRNNTEKHLMFFSLF